MKQPSEITGCALIGSQEQHGGNTFTAVNPATGEHLGPTFHESTAADVDTGCKSAAAAFGGFSELAPAARAAFLRCIASEIMALGEALIERAMAETALPRVRLEGERTRTVSQLECYP